MRIRRSQPQAAKHTSEAHSTYTADLGVPDRRRYRRTALGAPTVADLVRPGDTVSTTYNTGGVVIEVKEYFYAAPTDGAAPPADSRVPQTQVNYTANEVAVLHRQLVGVFRQVQF